MKNTKQQLAKDLYLHTDKTQSEIADILSVDRKTVYLWMKGGKWEEMRIAARQTASVIQQNLYNHIDEVEKKIRRRDPDDRCPTMQEVEMLRKLINLTKVVGAKTAATYMEVFEQAILYAAKTDKDLATKMTKLADKMIRATILDMDFNRTELRLDVEAKLDELDKQEAEFARTHPMDDGGEFEFSTEFPGETHGEKMGKNGEFSSHQPTPAHTTTTTPKPATNNTYEENNNEINREKFPIPDFSANGEFSSPAASPAGPKNEGKPLQGFGVNEGKPLQGFGVNEGKPLQGFGVNEGKPLQGFGVGLTRKQKNEMIIAKEDYYKYSSFLRYPASKITAILELDGRERNAMAFDYNLRQLRLCEEDQVMLTDEEFIYRFTTDPAFRDAHLNYRYPHF